MQLEAVALSPTEQVALQKDFGQAIVPSFLVGTTILELKAVTSNAQEKRVYLVVPDVKRGPPRRLLGLECNGACFTVDPQPMMFVGEPDR
jgi:hypothetical protein